VQVRFLGTGTSQGVPLIGCKCKVCTSTHAKDARLRSAIHIQSDTTSIVIDTGPDFRQQMLRAQIEQLDAVVFTHSHKDHIAGLDDIRAYNYILKKAIDVYATKATQIALHKEFEYIFNGTNYPGIPQVNMHLFEHDAFTIGDITLQPIEVWHHKMQVHGFRINNFTYITDANYIDPNEYEKIKGSNILVLNALRHEKHISHFCLEEAIGISQNLGVAQTYLTHISHQLGLHDDVCNLLPNGCTLAFDNLIIEI
jgi:phosphoribosyl 1,2-cyclic phosphate phosphodiesterase